MRRRNRSLRFLDEEWAQVTASANTAGQSVGAYLRDVLLRPTVVDVSNEERLIAAVDAAGRPLNALAHEYHLQGAVVVDKRLKGALEDFRAVLEDIETTILGGS